MNEKRPPPHRRYDSVSAAMFDGAPGLLGASAWERCGVRVISTLVEADLPDGSGRAGPQWHLSLSWRGKRPSPEHIAMVLRDFDLVGAEEDNHHPGVARHFWMPVDPALRVDCECKETETVVVEPDGYKWTNPKPEVGECRGCELARLIPSRRCSIHFR